MKKFNVNEVALIFQRSPKTIYNWIDKGFSLTLSDINERIDAEQKRVDQIRTRRDMVAAMKD